MKPKKKLKSHTKHQREHLPLGMQKTRVVSSSSLPKESPSNTFTPMETGQPDQDRGPDVQNPQAVRGGLGPLNEEGEGDRQNDQLAELEQIEPKK